MSGARKCARVGCENTFTPELRRGRNSGRAMPGRKRIRHTGRRYCSDSCRVRASIARKEAHLQRVYGPSEAVNHQTRPTPLSTVNSRISDPVGGEHPGMTDVMFRDCQHDLRRAHPDWSAEQIVDFIRRTLTPPAVNTAQNAAQMPVGASSVAVTVEGQATPLSTVNRRQKPRRTEPVQMKFGDYEVVPDEKYPGVMYRVRRPDGTLTDMVNLTRARDAARCFAESAR
jgi:hypothetical protein